jgi:hypothetical protein
MESLDDELESDEAPDDAATLGAETPVSEYSGSLLIEEVASMSVASRIGRAPGRDYPRFRGCFE